MPTLTTKSKPKAVRLCTPPPDAHMETEALTHARNVGVPLRIAVVTNKRWNVPASGTLVLGVRFLDTANAELKNKIIAHMNAWADRGCAIRFAESTQNAVVRIARTPGGGYWSYLGTDVLSIPAGQATMNLDSFSLSTPDREYLRVVRHETGHCFAGDTLVDCPRDLTKYPHGIPIRDLVGTQPWVYAWKDGTLVVRRASRVWLSRRNAETVRVLLKPGPGPKNRAFLPPQELVGTRDHRVMLADGVTWKTLGELKPGDRLCSVYRQKNGRRSRIVWTGAQRVREHTFVAEQVYGARPTGYDAHHKNENMLDQSPDNLEWKLEADHCRDHIVGRVDSPETSARKSAAQTGRRHTDETRAKMSVSQKAKAPASAATRAKISVATRGRPQSPEQLAKKSEAMKRFYAAGNRSGMYGKTASDEARRKRSETMKATLARKRAAAVNNHTVVSVESGPYQDVYDMSVPDAESFVANGVVVHNCLGCPHEHMRRELVARLDPAKTVAYFRQTQGWSAQMTQQQVLTPLNEATLMGTPVDEDSIMSYQLPGDITRDGRPIRGGLDINDSDAAFMARIYPGAAAPTPPPVQPAAVLTIDPAAKRVKLPPDWSVG